MGVDFPEPGETVTYCFAIATWHLIDEIEVGVKISTCTRNHSGTEPELVSSHRLLLYCHRTTFIPSCRNAISSSLFQFIIPEMNKQL